MIEVRIFPGGSPAHVSHCPWNIDQFFVFPPIREDIGRGIGSIDTSLIIDSIDFSVPRPHTLTTAGYEI